MLTVTVYYFTDYDVSADQVVRSKRPATRTAIERMGARYQIIEESAIEVTASDLDESGFLAKDAPLQFKREEL